MRKKSRRRRQEAGSVAKRPTIAPSVPMAFFRKSIAELKRTRKEGRTPRTGRTGPGWRRRNGRKRDGLHRCGRHQDGRHRSGRQQDERRRDGRKRTGGSRTADMFKKKTTVRKIM